MNYQKALGTPHNLRRGSNPAITGRDSVGRVDNTLKALYRKFRAFASKS